MQDNEVVVQPESSSSVLPDDAPEQTNLIKTQMESNYGDALARMHDNRSLKHLREIESRDVTSPFEKLWPRYHLPLWAMKEKNFDVAPENSICFVHVGKAGGSAGESIFDASIFFLICDSQPCEQSFCNI